LPAAADDPTVFACDTEPSLPGLSTRTETEVFDGSICVACDSAVASWPVDADWSDVWIGALLPEQPHELPPAAVCVPVWLVPAALPASAREPTAFVCDTLPSLPGLSTRIGTFVLLAPVCEASDRAAASWSVDADCVEDWIALPPAVWLEPCDVLLALPAAAEDPAVFACVTLPSLPGLRTRIEMFVLLGLVCVALDAAAACCEVSAD
jgi:hypothetical protein